MSNHVGAALTDQTLQIQTAGRGLISGSLSVAGARLVRQLAQLAIFIVGARALGPVEFGVFALVSALASLAYVVAIGGFNSFILAVRVENEDSSNVLSHVLVVACLAGLAVGLIASLAGVLSFAASDDVTMLQLGLLFGIWIFLAANADAQAAVLIRSGSLTRVAAGEVAAEVFGLATAIWLLHAGLGAPALVIGRIAAQGTQLTFYVAASRTVPTLRFWRIERVLLRALSRHSWHILATRFLFTLRDSVASFMIGAFLGAASVGLFRASQRMVGALHELVSEPARLAGWVILRRAAGPDGHASGEAAHVQRTVEWLMPLLLAVAAPLYLGVALMAEPIVVIVLGESWRDAAAIVRLLALGAVLLVPSVLSEPLLGLSGNMRFLPRVSLINTAVLVWLVLVACRFDIVHVAAAQLAASGVLLATTIWLQAEVVGLSWRSIARRCAFLVPLLAAMVAVASGVEWLAGYLGATAIQSLLIASAGAAAFYLAALVVARSDALASLGQALRHEQPVSG